MRTGEYAVVPDGGISGGQGPTATFPRFEKFTAAVEHAKNTATIDKPMNVVKVVAVARAERKVMVVFDKTA